MATASFLAFSVMLVLFAILLFGWILGQRVQEQSIRVRFWVEAVIHVTIVDKSENLLLYGFVTPSSSCMCP